MHDAARWGLALQHLDEKAALFKLVWARAENPGRIKIGLLCDDAHWDRVRLWLDHNSPPEFKTDRWYGSRVDAVFFQGPHFGDRYGIMDYTFKALDAHRVPLLSAVCSVASIYLLLPVGWGQKAKMHLTAAFEIPKEKRDVGPAGRAQGRSGNDGGQRCE